MTAAEIRDIAWDEHPEHHCARCGGPNITWHAPSPLWNEVMRGGDINAAELYDGIVCPVCFAQLAEAQGIAGLWRVDAARVAVPLVTTTPSGRVWNAETWMWDQPSTVYQARAALARTTAPLTALAEETTP